MTGPSDKAVEAGRRALDGKPVPKSYGMRVLDAAYPIIRADVIAEVVEALRSDELATMAACLAAKRIERKFGG